jgi:molecular chaperone DnaK
MAMIVGIDLGTTFSATALVREGVPQILWHGDERIMPSVVGLTPEGTLLVGTPARNQYTLYPERTIRSIKRKMGQDTTVTLGERDYTPQEISALILRELKSSAEAQLGQEVAHAVITVPAYFSDAARQATREAGEIAGFTVERIINEPTAAALAYGLDRSDERQLVAVYDLGGGTFDVSIIELDAGVVEVRASHGDTQLGGDDFDQRLVDYLAERFLEEHDADPRLDPRALARLTRAAEEAKIALSSEPFVQVREEYLLIESGRPLHLDVQLARTDFEDLIGDLIERTLTAFDAALTDASITAGDLDHVLFVGGSTRIPLVWQMVNAHTGIEPEIAINPDEAVALGAAVQAAIIAGEPLATILVDVTPHSLGIAVADWEFGHLVTDRYSVIIQRNTTIPTMRSEVYSALTPEQSAISLQVYQGESPIASRNTLLGEFLFDGLRSESPGQPPRVTVQFDFDIDGILKVNAHDRGSGKQAQISAKAARTRLSPADIARTRAELDLLEEAGLLEEEDEDDTRSSAYSLAGRTVEGEVVRSGVEEAHADARALLLRARRFVAEGLDDTAALEAAIAALETAVHEGDETEIEARSELLLDVLYHREDA